jgi:NAD(P)H-hydrate epimerase
MQFTTSTGIKVPFVSVEQMREIDRIAVEETAPNLLQMMENAGRNLAEVAIEILGDGWNDAAITVLAGNGNNGGGGICAARHLANHNGKISLITAPELKNDSARSYQMKILKSTDANIIGIDDIQKSEPDLIIDAVIGYGLNNKPRGFALELIRLANNSDAKIISLDIPSGINADTGESYGEHINASTTMTLALPKTGLISKSTGELILADIGIPAETYAKAGIKYISPFESGYRVALKVK